MEHFMECALSCMENALLLLWYVFSIHLFTVFSISVISCTIPAIFSMKSCSMLAFLVCHNQMVKVGFIYGLHDSLP